MDAKLRILLESESPAPGRHAVPPATSAQLMGLIDLTTLEGDDSRDRISDLCTKALESKVAAVCVYPVFVPQAKETLSGRLPVATVAGGFPHGLSPLSSRVHEVRECAQMGADEIDVVIRRELALTGQWQALADEVATLKDAAGNAHLKVILATGELGDAETIRKASLTALWAGADFVKTSTGKEKINATLEAGRAMCVALAIWQSQTGEVRGLKPAGGIRDRAAAEAWWDLVGGTLGPDWLSPAHFRIGASALREALLA